MLPAIMFNSEERMEGNRKGRRAGSERFKDLMLTCNILYILLEKSGEYLKKMLMGIYLMKSQKSVS